MEILENKLRVAGDRSLAGVDEDVFDDKHMLG